MQAIDKLEFRAYLLKRPLQFSKGGHNMDMQEVLENDLRAAIIDIILESPGIHFNKLLKTLRISPGSLDWHLDILITYHIIKKQREGQYMDYFPYTWDFANSDRTVLTLMKNTTTLKVFNLITRNPGIFQQNLAKILGVSRKTIQYHVNKLYTNNLVIVRKEGRQRHYYPNLESSEFH